MSLSMTVMELMKSDMALVEKAKLMKERFGCPGKKHPCIQSYAQGKMICEGCWGNFFNDQVQIKDVCNEKKGEEENVQV